MASVQEVAAIAQRGALTFGADPEMRFYAPETLVMVYQRTVVNAAGAGTLDVLCDRLAEDPALAEVPPAAFQHIITAALDHLAEAFGGRSRGGP